MSRSTPSPPPFPSQILAKKTKTKYSVVITSDSLQPSAHSTWGYIQCSNKKIASDNNEDFYLCECVYTGASKHANVTGTKSHRSHGDEPLLFVTVILSLRCHRSCARRKILASSTSKPFRDRRTAAGCSQPPDFSPKESEYPSGAILKIILLKQHSEHINTSSAGPLGRKHWSTTAREAVIWWRTFP